MPFFLKYFIAWFPMLLIAVINGSFRDLWYKKYLGELRAHQLSTLTLFIFFTVYIRFVIKKYPPASSAIAMALGLYWMLLTLAFEFGFGRMRGNSWEKLLADYNIAAGRIWVLIPLFLLIAPYIIYRSHSR